MTVMEVDGTPYPKRPLELYARTAEEGLSAAGWHQIIANEYCPFLQRRCAKTRKSDPSITIGTCIVGNRGAPVVICPYRFRIDGTIFADSIGLLRNHEPSNEIHIVPEIAIPGGTIDYFVVSVDGSLIVDYIGLEIQTLDTTGTVWPARQKLVRDLLDSPEELDRDDRSYNMNWKMTAKTILMQMHHKAETLELLHKKLVLVIQDVFFDYTVRAFSTASLTPAIVNDPVHFHIYTLRQGTDGRFSMSLTNQQSTTTVGVQQMLGRAGDATVHEENLVATIRSKLSAATRLT